MNPWTVARVANRAGWCWADVCSWAVDRTSSDGPSDEFEPRLRDAHRRRSCAREVDTIRRGYCYCGQVGPKSPGTARRIARRRRWLPGARHGAALLTAAVALLVLGGCTEDAPDPCTDRMYGSWECSGLRRACDVEPTLTPPPGAGAALVTRHLRAVHR